MIAALVSGGAMLSLLALALLPALAELRRPSVHGPLDVPLDHDNHIERFAHSYRQRLERVFGSPLARTLAEPDASEKARQQGIDCHRSGDAPPAEWNHPIVSSGDLVVPADAEVAQELYAGGELRLGARCRVRAALCDGTARLEPGARVTRWVHAREVSLATGSRVDARVSALERIVLAPGAECQRMHAPLVQATAADATRRGSQQPVLKTYAGERGKRSVWDPGGGRWIVFGPLVLPPGTRVSGHLIVRGDARIAKACRIEGSLKVHGRLAIDSDAHIAGACIAARDAQVGAGSSISGPLVCEGRLLLRGDASVGEFDALTTVTAGEVVLHPGARVHGSIWAKTRISAVRA